VHHLRPGITGRGRLGGASGQPTLHILGSAVQALPVVYDPSLTGKDYRAWVGGPAKQSDVKYIRLTKVNNSGFSLKRGIPLGRLVTQGR
jgi:hypothetical protein